jgi:DNA-binding MarR family transcriptional regulator
MAKDLRPLGNPGSESFQVERYPFYQLNRVVSRYNVVIATELRQLEIDIPTWRVLMILGERAPLPIGQVANLVANLAVINISTLMRIVDRMGKVGLIKSTQSASDGRVTELALTPAGRAKLTAARKVTAPIYERLIRGFSASDFAQLLDLLNQLSNNLEKPQA